MSLRDREPGGPRRGGKPGSGVEAVAEENRAGSMRARRLPRWRVFALVVLIGLAACVGGLAIIETRPSLAAQIADLLRTTLGPRVVASLEAVVFQAQDAFKRWEYQVGGEQAEAPWASDATRPGSDAASQPPPHTGEPGGGAAAPTSEAASTAPAPSPARLVSPGPPATPTPAAWQPAPLPPMGDLEGEGIWQPYLYDRDDGPVAARTFLQPDRARPYAVVAIVAFDLTRTRLHFVLGYRDPGLTGGPRGDGLIPAPVRESGALLAAFNGGFRTANGMYGAMADGIVAVPAIPGMATVAIHQSGEVRIGAWGEDIHENPDLEAWRQNCAPVVRDGQISERVYNDSLADWGGSVSGSVVTWRSGLGLDRAGKTLYYFAGPSLSMPALAQAMIHAGVHDGMLLDINAFWVHFTAIRLVDGQMVAEALLPQSMIDKVDRYLLRSPVDFFYVTLWQGS